MTYNIDNKAEYYSVNRKKVQIILLKRWHAAAFITYVVHMNC